jgi:hypothetical protein
MQALTLGGSFLLPLFAAGLLARHPQTPTLDRFHYAGVADSPARQISLRAIDPERYSIVNEAGGGEVLEEIEESKAFFEVYDGAVYLFQVRIDRLESSGHACYSPPQVGENQAGWEILEPSGEHRVLNAARRSSMSAGALSSFPGVSRIIVRALHCLPTIY